MAEAVSKIVPTEKVFLWPTAKADAADDFRPYMELYLHEDAKVRPAMVIFPGGGYSMRAAHEGVDIAAKFLQLGFNCFVVQYRVAPHRYPEPQLDAFRAIRLVRANAAKWRVNGNMVATLGFSAGGHLCASTGVLYDALSADAGDAADKFSQRSDALVLCYPVISFCSEFGHRGSGENLLGGELSPSHPAFSLEKLVGPDTPPAFLWHTASDGGVPVENSIVFARAMQKNKRAWGLHVFANGPHGLGLAPQYPDVAVWPELTRDFLRDTCGFDC